MSSPRTPPVVEASTAREDISELGASGASDAVSKTVDDFKHVWEFGKVEKLGGPTSAPSVGIAAGAVIRS